MNTADQIPPYPVDGVPNLEPVPRGSGIGAAGRLVGSVQAVDSSVPLHEDVLEGVVVVSHDGEVRFYPRPNQLVGVVEEAP